MHLLCLLPLHLAYLETQGDLCAVDSRVWQQPLIVSTWYFNTQGQNCYWVVHLEAIELKNLLDAGRLR